jgi:hypothetical protein
MKRYVVKKSGLMIAAFGSLALVACGGGDDDDGDDDDGPDPVTTGAYHHYVNDTVAVPNSSSEAMMYGINLDADPLNKPDNALGNILSTLSGQGVDIQAQVDTALMEGSLVLLHSIRTDDDSVQSDTSVQWQVYLGDGITGPVMGGGTFTVQAGSPMDAKLIGSLNGGFFEGGPGNVTIQLSLTAGAPLEVKLIGTRIEADMTATGCTNGKLGGAITDEELHSSVIPGIADLMNSSIADDGGIACSMANDPACPTTPDVQTCDVERSLCITSTSGTILDLFDDDKDGAITTLEIEMDPLITALLAPDVDLLDADGKFAPRVDGTKDSLSLGLGFTCGTATFTGIGEE